MLRAFGHSIDHFQTLVIPKRVPRRLQHVVPNKVATCCVEKLGVAIVWPGL